MNTPVTSQGLTDRDLIEGIVTNFWIVDYGFITKVNDDGTVNVTHARKGMTRDGKEMPEYQTKNIEPLTISCAEFSLKMNMKDGDKVLLLGLKDYVKECGEITQAQVPEVGVHYARNNMKALPLSVFNSDSKVKIEFEDGNISIKTDGTVAIDAGNGDVTITTKGAATITAEGGFSVNGNLEVSK